MIRKFRLIACCTVLVMLISSCKSDKPVINEEKPVESNVTVIESEPELTEEQKAAIELENRKKEREELEAKRKEELKEFYVPLITIGEEKEKTVIKAKALYTTASTAGYEINNDNIQAYKKYIEDLKNNNTILIEPEVNRFEKIIAIASATEVNSVIIDIKDDEGYITYNSDVEIVKNINYETKIKIDDIKNVLKVLKDNNIYTIARIVVFKDKNFAEKLPEHAIKLKSGEVWYDKYSNGVPWVNPYDRYVWDYNIAIAREAALLGFDEINFDYIRFPDNAKYYNPLVEFEGRNDMDKDECIREFLAYSWKQLEEYNVNLSVDVFGLITRNWDDYPEDIGQTWRLMSENVDYISPMVYPSHYGPGWYGTDNPNAHPYQVVRGAMEEALEKNAAMENPATIRPWIQDFDWAGIYYDSEKVRAQIIACKELGIDEYFVWNPGNYYDAECFIETKEEQNTAYPIVTEDTDYRGRTPLDAANRYLQGEFNGYHSYMYLLTPKDYRPSDYDEFVSKIDCEGYKLLDYKVKSWQYEEGKKDRALVNLSYKYGKVDKNNNVVIEENQNDWWTVIKEDGIWKVIKQINVSV